MSTPVVFRRLPADGTPPLGELWLRAREATDRQRRADALLMVEAGPGAFLRGEGPVERLVLDVANVGPTLDEMLAAHLAPLALAGADLRGYEPFARYAAAVREGLSPGDQPPEAALENVFQAVRNQDGEDLTDPAVAAHFLDGWARLAARINEAVARGDGPGAAGLFAGDRFLRERAYLRQDEGTYRDDVRRGERWVARVPGQLPRCSALLLRRPHSKLFKYWARKDLNSPTGEPYALLAVDWGEGNWVCSTDPGRALSLKALAERLQRAEDRAGPAGERAWFDGADFRHTLIASPRGGARLSPRQVERVIRAWTRRWPRVALPLAMAAALALLVVGSLAATHIGGGTKPPPQPDPVFDPWPAVQVARPAPRARQALAGSVREASFPVQGSGVARDVHLEVRVQGPPAEQDEPIRAEVVVNGKARQVEGTFRGGAGDLGPVPARLRDEDNRVTVRLLGERPALTSIDLRVEEPVERPTLHVLTVGVSNYPSPHIEKLDFAHRDAAELAGVLGRQTALFRVPPPRVLVNEKATRDNVLTALRQLVVEVKKAREAGQGLHLVVIALSGHGWKDPEIGERFVYLPYDYDPDRGPDATGVTGTALRDHLNELPCPVVLLLDTCYSGAMRVGAKGGPGGGADGDAREALRRLKGVARGVVLITACGKDQKARESRLWGDGHGALTFAVLEALRARPGGGRGVVYLNDVFRKVDERCRELYRESKWEEPSIVLQAGGVPLDTIPLALVEGPSQ